jgi:hypothetical protein
VVCLNGDSSMLMSLGTLVTIAACGAANLVLFVLENDTYSSREQAIPGAGRVDFRRWPAPLPARVRLRRGRHLRGRPPSLLEGAGRCSSR